MPLEIVLFQLSLNVVFLVGLSKEQAWFCKLIFCTRYVDCCSFAACPSQTCSEAAVFREHGVLELEGKAYFTLYEDQSRDAFVADLIPFRIAFAAIGVATFWPDRLEAISQS